MQSSSRPEASGGQRRLIVLRAIDAVLPQGTEFEANMRCFADEAVLVFSLPWVGWDFVPNLHPVVGERRDRRTFDEGFEALLCGGVMTGVDLVGFYGGAKGLEVGLYAQFGWMRANAGHEPIGHRNKRSQTECHDGEESEELLHALPTPAGEILAGDSFWPGPRR